MKEIILEVLKKVACGNTGNCQINLQSESAQIMIADEIMKKLDPYVQELGEDIVLGEKK